MDGCNSEYLRVAGVYAEDTRGMPVSTDSFYILSSEASQEGYQLWKQRPLKEPERLNSGHSQCEHGVLTSPIAFCKLGKCIPCSDTGNAEVGELFQCRFILSSFLYFCTFAIKL